MNGTFRLQNYIYNINMIMLTIHIKYIPLLKINCFSKYFWLQSLHLLNLKNVTATGKLSTIDISKNHRFGRVMKPI